MLVSDISRERQDDLVSLSATYHWEDVDREPQRIFLRYGAHDSYFDDAALAMPFLIAAVVPALENVTLYPHIGSATKETRDAMGFVALDNLDAVFGGRTPPNRVA